MSFDKDLRAALLDAAGAEAETLAALPLPVPGPGYLRFRRRLLRDPFGAVSRAARPVWRRPLRAAAMVLLALTLAVSLSLLSPTIRAAARGLIRRWTQTDYTDHLEITFPRVKGEGPLGVWALSAPPEGYTESRGQVDEERGWIEYTNAEGQWLQFSYRLMDEGTEIALNNENVEYSELEIMGCRAFLQESTKDSVPSGLMWFDEDFGIVFDVSGFVSGEELIELAQNVQKID